MSLLDKFRLRSSKIEVNSPPSGTIPRQDGFDDDDEKKNEEHDEKDPNEETSVTNPAIQSSDVDEEDPDTKKEDKQMSTSTPAAPDTNKNPALGTQPASFAELSTMIDPGTPDRQALICNIMEKSMTVADAQKAYNAHLLASVAKANEKVEMASRVASVPTGANPVPNRTAAPGIAQKYAHFTDYMSLIAHFEGPDGGELDRGKATIAANKYRPDLREKYIGMADVPGKGGRRMPVSN